MSKAKNPFHYNTRKRFDVDENRVLTNEILKAAFRGVGDPFGLVQMGFRIDADPLELLQTAPGLIETLKAAGHLKKGTLLEEDGWVLSTILDHLVSTLARARSGNEFAVKQIQAVEKLLEPERYDLPVTALDELLEKHHTRAALARGCAIRELMGRLSWGIEPSKPGKNVLEGTVRLTSNPHFRDETTFWKVYGKWRSAYDVALEHWPKRGAPTLKSLAIKVYLRQLWDEGFTNISEERLVKDLRELEEWEKSNESRTRLKIFNAGGDPLHLPWHAYSEGWKRSGHYEQNKKPAKGARKGGKKQ